MDGHVCVDSDSDIIERIENRVANYYNDTYLSADKSGKYVVLHDETTVSGDLCNVIVRYHASGDSDVGEQGAYIADVSVNIITGDCDIHSIPKREEPKRTTACKVKCITAVLILLNILFIPFLSDEDGLFVENGERVRAHSFADMAESLSEGNSSDDIPIDGLYYIGCSLCALVIFVSALGNLSEYCTVGAAVGTALSMYIYYQIYLGKTRWYIGLQDAHLTFGYYISCIGFIVILITSLHQKHE